MGTPPTLYRREDIRHEIDGWLNVRHKLAHGDTLPKIVFVSTAQAPHKGRANPSSLHAEQCVEFFEAVVSVTAPWPS